MFARRVSVTSIGRCQNSTNDYSPKLLPQRVTELLIKKKKSLERKITTHKNRSVFYNEVCNNKLSDCHPPDKDRICFIHVCKKRMLGSKANRMYGYKIEKKHGNKTLFEYLVRDSEAQDNIITSKVKTFGCRQGSSQKKIKEGVIETMDINYTQLKQWCAMHTK